MKHSWLVLTPVLLLAGCDKDSPAAPALRTFSANGIVKQLEPDGKTVVIQHEAISNYMAAMTMPFEVHDTNELRGLKAGDAISFQLVVSSTDGWVEKIARRQTGPSAAPVATNAPGIQVSRAVEPLDEGDLLPDGHFTNELGQSVSLSRFKGRVFAFTFFFTSCPFPNFCPRLTSNFAAAAAQLSQRPDAPAGWQLLSISFDPKTDIPSRLLAYAQAAHYDPAHWSFLTGSLDQIAGLADAFGENFSTEGGSISHNLRTVVVDPNGRVRKIYQGNAWTSEDLVREMVEAGGKKKN